MVTSGPTNKTGVPQREEERLICLSSLQFSLSQIPGGRWGKPTASIRKAVQVVLHHLVLPGFRLRLREILPCTAKNATLRTSWVWANLSVKLLKGKLLLLRIQMVSCFSFSASWRLIKGKFARHILHAPLNWWDYAQKVIAFWCE